MSTKSNQTDWISFLGEFDHSDHSYHQRDFGQLKVTREQAIAITDVMMRAPSQPLWQV